MTDLTARSEDIERAELDDLHTVATAAVRARLGLQLEEIGGALVSVAAGEPSILINRTVGLGLDQPATPAAIERIAGSYRAAGIARYFVQIAPDAGPPDLRAMLAAAGLEKARGWMKFTRGTAPPPRSRRRSPFARSAPSSRTTSRALPPPGSICPMPRSRSLRG